MADHDWDATSHHGQIPVVLGDTANHPVPIHSQMGRGPVGPVGPPGPQGPEVDATTLAAAVAAEMDARIVVVAYDAWPPAAPVNGVLYLRAAPAPPVP